MQTVPKDFSFLVYPRSFPVLFLAESAGESEVFTLSCLDCADGWLHPAAKVQASGGVSLLQVLVSVAHK